MAGYSIFGTSTAASEPAPAGGYGIFGTEEAPPTEAVPAPADDGWAGGLWSDIKHVASRIPQNAAEIGRSLTQLPGQVVNEVNDAANFLTGGLSDKAIAAAEKVPGPDVSIPGLMTVGERQQSPGPRTLDEVTPSNVLQAPIARLLPGAFVGDKLANDPGAIAENPVVAALDVLPFIGKAGKVATKGSQFAESAAARATEIGKVAKADRITNQGMKLPEIAQEALRRTEDRIVQKYPQAFGKMPSDKLEQYGLGGERLREALKNVGTRGRAYAKDVADSQQRILDGTAKWEAEGVDPTRQSQLLKEAEVADRAWWDALPDADRGFLRWFDEQQDELFRQYDKTFEVAGEKFTKAQSPTAYRHWQRMQNLQKWRQNLEQRVAKSPEAQANLDRTKTRYDIAIGERERLLQNAIKQEPAAKWTALINERMRPGIEKAIADSRAKAEAEGWDFPVPEEMVGRLLASGSYRQLQRMGAISDSALNKIGKEITATVDDLRKAGYDPMYHHHAVRRERLANPRFDPIHLLKDPNAIKRRGWDMEPWVPEASVSLLDQAVDLVQAKHANEWMSEMQRNGMLKSTQQVALEIGTAADRIVAGMDPEKAVTALPEITKQLQQKLYAEFSPSGGMLRPKMAGGANKLYIPKGIADVIESVGRPPRLHPSLPDRPGVASLPMRAFRVSVLYLQPGYYIGNSIGNALMMSARGNPLDLRYAAQAAKAWKRGELPLEISTGAVMGTADESFRSGLHRMGWQVIDDLDRSVWSKTKDRAARAEHFLQRFAGALDDMTKATAYFAEFNRATKGGADADLAIARAVEHMNKVNMGFDTLLPAERAVMRGVLMPFYSWSKFALGYIMSYPFDHPWRAAVLNSLGNQIREEWDERLPERLMGYWAVGETKDGKTKLYPASGIYPFQSFFSTDDIWAGVARRMSPILQTYQERSGLDPFTGAPDPYLSFHDENWTADKVTGKPRFVRPSLGRLLAENFLPHSEAVFKKLDPEEQEYYRKNPGRWFEDMMRTFGVTVPITRDLDEERQKMAQTFSRFGGGPETPPATPEPLEAKPAPAKKTGYSLFGGS